MGAECLSEKDGYRCQLEDDHLGPHRHITGSQYREWLDSGGALFTSLSQVMPVLDSEWDETGWRQ